MNQDMLVVDYVSISTDGFFAFVEQDECLRMLSSNFLTNERRCWPTKKARHPNILGGRAKGGHGRQLISPNLRLSQEAHTITAALQLFANNVYLQSKRQIPKLAPILLMLFNDPLIPLS